MLGEYLKETLQKMPPPETPVRQQSGVLLERLKERYEPSLGERNPLITRPNLGNPEAISALKLVIENTIASGGGMQPVYMESGYVWEPSYKKEFPRFMVRFETDSLSEAQLEMLEQVVKITYGQSARTRQDSQGNQFLLKDTRRRNVHEKAIQGQMKGKLQVHN